MKNKDLIEQLKKGDPDAEIILDLCCYGITGVTMAQIIEVEDIGANAYERPYSGTNIGEHPRVEAIILS